MMGHDDDFEFHRGLKGTKTCAKTLQTKSYKFEITVKHILYLAFYKDQIYIFISSNLK